MRPEAARGDHRFQAGNARCLARIDDTGSEGRTPEAAEQRKARASVRAVIESAMAEVAATLGQEPQSLVWDMATDGDPRPAGTDAVAAGRVAVMLNLLQGLMQMLAPLMQIFCAGTARRQAAGGRRMKGGIASNDAALPMWMQVPALPHEQYAPQWERQAYALTQLGLQALGAGLLVLAHELVSNTAAGPPAGARAAGSHHAFRRSPAAASGPDG
ncbi:hypothetical protein M8A51_18235 [Schlegelella sp. S2-27]|uniref:Uncharacterized protein n=1 Tax=Caldimonas mangrovi TaxID=2944811 RepID=A0ABT0YRU8_9BURK|nr:hypothetical protein [Caldimonas mangrovi]MCM5681470.1 hypothetical protein [Caldimonas mangrovi]